MNLRQVRRPAARYLVPLFQQLAPPPRLALLDRLTTRHTRPGTLGTFVSLGLTQPFEQRDRMDPEVLGDLRDRHSGLAAASNPNDIVTNSRGRA
jgi:hypothetical protein